MSKGLSGSNTHPVSLYPQWWRAWSIKEKTTVILPQGIPLIFSEEVWKIVKKNKTKWQWRARTHAHGEVGTIPAAPLEKPLPLSPWLPSRCHSRDLPATGKHGMAGFSGKPRGADKVTCWIWVSKLILRSTQLTKQSSWNTQKNQKKPL